MLIFTLLDYKRIFPDFQGRYMEVQQNYSTCESSAYSNGNGSNDSMRKMKSLFQYKQVFHFFILHKHCVYSRKALAHKSGNVNICYLYCL